MSNFKKASQQKLRFQTTQGQLSTEQLWDLSLTQLSALVKNLKKVLSKTTEDESLAFLEEDFKVDKEAELRFEIAKEIYLSKKEALDLEKSAASVKEHNQHILSLIAEKEKSALKEMSVEELKGLLK